MRFSRVGEGGSDLPDARRIPKDAIPVTSRTARELSRTIHVRAPDGISKTAWGNNALILKSHPPKIGRRVGELASMSRLETSPSGESLLTEIRVVPRSFRRATVKKDEVIIPLNVLTSLSTPDSTPVKDAFANADKSKAEMQELTGLPNVTEGEVKRLIAELQTDIPERRIK